MRNSLFREGGPYKVRRVGRDQHEFSIPLPDDADGMRARECPDEGCSPGFFKIRGGTGITTPGYDTCFCPYCRHRRAPSAFVTKAQRDYAHSVLKREAVGAVQDMIKDAFKLGPSGRHKFGGGFVSMELSYKPGSKPPIRHPYEEELRRDVTCPRCTLEHAVFGLATWCPDCGADIFPTHVALELDVLRKALGDVDQRRERLGARIAERDVENALEDTVSIFEAAMKIILRRALSAAGSPAEGEQAVAAARNAFQNLDRARELVNEKLGADLFEGIASEMIDAAKMSFEKRHPIAHNLGVVDRKFLERVRSDQALGRELRVTSGEVLRTIDFVRDVIERICAKLFSQIPEPRPAGEGG